MIIAAGLRRDVEANLGALKGLLEAERPSAPGALLD